MNSQCTCGEAAPHVVARRESADGLRVELWDNGAVTSGFGYAINGVSIARPRTIESLEVSRAAGWLFADEVCLWDRGDLGALYAVCRRIAARGGLPGDVRAGMYNRDAPRIPIRWEVLQADRDGKATCRVGHLPRLMFAGVGVWHERGLYEVMHWRPSGNGRSGWHGSGITFASQRELLRHLSAEQMS